jgi:DNA-binding response OmpR family regulator
MSSESVILIERPQRTSFADTLRKRYTVIVVASGKQAIEAARMTADDSNSRLPLAVILDSISMRTTGERVAKQIKAELSEIPLIHLHPGPKDGAQSPADVVLIPPFTARKLTNSIARVARSPEPAADGELIAVGHLAMNVTRRTLIVNGQEISLTPKAALLAEFFLRHPGETLHRKDLMEKVWQTDYLGDTRTLDVHIRWIRRAIEDNPDKPIYLTTIRGVGYRLDIPTKATGKVKNSNGAAK